MKKKDPITILENCSPDADGVVKVSGVVTDNHRTDKVDSRKTAYKDLTGMRFGRLTAIRLTEKRMNKKVVWECRCNCGNETMYDIENNGKLVYVLSTKLTRGHTRSCGCLQKESAAKTEQKRSVDLTGQRFGRLIAIQPTDKRVNAKVVWECICDCGNTVYRASAALRTGNTSSCGCLRKETAPKNLAGKKQRAE